MPERQQLRLFEALLKVSERELGGSVLRGTIILGYAAPLRKLANLSATVAEHLVRAERAYVFCLRHGGEPATSVAKEMFKRLEKALGSAEVKSVVNANRPLAKAEALSRGEAARLANEKAPAALVEYATDLNLLLRGELAAAVTTQDITQARRLIKGWRRAIEQDVEQAGAVMERTAEQRAENFARRGATRQYTLDAGVVQQRVERLLVEQAQGSDPASKALALYQQTVSHEYLEEVWPIADRLSVFKNGLKKPDQLTHLSPSELGSLEGEAVKQLFRPEISSLKGLLLEKWFWCSRAWREQERILLADATKLAESLGEEWEAIVVRSPLLLSGKEIYDGAIIVARKAGKGEAGRIGFLHTAIEIKAERQTSVVAQVNRDLARENNVMKGTQLVTREGNLAFTLNPPPPQAPTNRIIVAPSLPPSKLESQAFVSTQPDQIRPLRQRGAVQTLTPGTNLLYQTTLLSAEQLDDLALLFIRAAVGSQD